MGLLNHGTRLTCGVLCVAVAASAEGVERSARGNGLPQEGLTLINQTNATTTSAIDLEGTVVQTWTGAAAPASFAYLRADGSLIRPTRANTTAFNRGAAGGRIQTFDPTGAIVWDFTYANASHRQHHDIAPLPNGNILMIAWELKTQQEALDAGRIGATTEMWPDTIVEVQPTGPTTGAIVWEWHFWDHLIQDADPAKPNFGVVADHPERLDINFGNANGDWNHINAIDHDPVFDQIVISSRSFNEFYVIDHSTTTAEAAGSTGGNAGKGGDFLYRWGNPAVYQRGDAGDQQFFVLHGVNWVACGLPGAGNILAFNNGDRPGAANDYSTVLEIAPPRQPDGTFLLNAGVAFGPAAATWSYGGPGDFYGGPTQCGAFRLPNGHTLITSATDGRVFEVTSAGDTVWEYDHPGSVPRAPRFWTAIDGSHAGPGIAALDSDGDGVCDDGDACPFDDPDDPDQDGFCSSDDNCPDHGNVDQSDCDGDGMGDVCVLADGLDSDCNTNAVPDACDIAGGTSQDLDGDGMPDECAACTVTSCCDAAPEDQVRDDACTWCDCDGDCQQIPIAFADMGGPFGACVPDGFANVHDRVHALTCFAGDNPCVTLNLDAGGSFGACAPDGFCNIHDANHALAAFAGTSTCACPGGPAPEAPGVPVDSTALQLDADRKVLHPGDRVLVTVSTTADLPALQSYQLHLVVKGGRRGGLDLVDVQVDCENGAFIGRSDRFDAVNLERGQMLAGLETGSVSIAGGACLATFAYEAGRRAQGRFVIDVRYAAPADQTFLVAPGQRPIAMTAANAVTVDVSPLRERFAAPMRSGRPR